MGIIDSVGLAAQQAQKAAAYDSLRANEEAKYIAGLMQADGFQKGLAAARANAPMYAANDELKYYVDMDKINYGNPAPTYGASVAPTGDVRQGARMADLLPVDKTNPQQDAWLEQYRKNKGQ